LSHSHVVADFPGPSAVISRYRLEVYATLPPIAVHGSAWQLETALPHLHPTRVALGLLMPETPFPSQEELQKKIQELPNRLQPKSRPNNGRNRSILFNSTQHRNRSKLTWTASSFNRTRQRRHSRSRFATITITSIAFTGSKRKIRKPPARLSTPKGTSCCLDQRVLERLISSSTSLS